MSFHRLLRLVAFIGFHPWIGLADDLPPAPPLEVRTPAAPPTPRINGPRVYGARPGHPFFYRLPVTGERPMKFEAKGLPAGLALDPATGNVTGTAAERGTSPVEFTATNAHGSSKATMNIVIGDTICLTPPLGWNSWNHFANRVTDKDVRDAADAMVSSGLIDHGWTYINVDDCWQGVRDAEGNIHGNEKFPDMKALADYVHARGLKFGIYTSPGSKTCAGFEGSLGHEEQDARTYADWGVDYVKYDLCSYGGNIREHLRERTAALLPEGDRNIFLNLSTRKDELRHKKDLTPQDRESARFLDEELTRSANKADPAKLKAYNLEEQQIPYRVFGQFLAKVPRDIVYSFCQYGNADVWEWGPTVGGNCWRTTGDISANWKSMTDIGFSQDRLAKFAGPGHWNDPDMLEVGNAGLTPDECYTHMTLWCMLSAPLLIGCDMSKMDPFTVRLFSNDEVLAVNQDALGAQGQRIKNDGTTEVWIKQLANDTLAVALFNCGDKPAEIRASLLELVLPFGGLTVDAPPKPVVRDLWRQKTIGRMVNQEIVVQIAPHRAELLSVSIHTTRNHL